MLVRKDLHGGHEDGAPQSLLQWEKPANGVQCDIWHIGVVYVNDKCVSEKMKGAHGDSAGLHQSGDDT